MATGDVGGNDYWMTFEIRPASGNVHSFDCFECVVTRLDPVCEHCECRILGHGVEVAGRFYCCAHCARVADSELGAQIRDAVGVHTG